MTLKDKDFRDAYYEMKEMNLLDVQLYSDDCFEVAVRGRWSRRDSIQLSDSVNGIDYHYIQNHEPADEAAKIYLFDLRKTGNRSEYNNDKAAARYPDIYEHFKDDDEYSFYFTDDYSKEVTLDQLLEKLKRRSDS